MHAQNGRHFADDIFQMHFVYQNVCIMIQLQISLNCVPKGPIDNIVHQVICTRYVTVSRLICNSIVTMNSPCGWCCITLQCDPLNVVNFLETLHWRHNDEDSVSNHQPHVCLLNRLFRRRSKKTSKAPRHWPLCGEFTGTGEFPAQRASNAENVSIWWRHHVFAINAT